MPRDWDDSKIVLSKLNSKYKDGYQLETFSISFKNVTNNDVDLVLSWGDIYVTVPISVPTRELVDAQIKSIMDGEPKASDYLQLFIIKKKINVIKL